VRAFVTGGTGYIGSKLIEALVNANYEVTALKRKGSNTNKVYKNSAIKYCDYNGSLENLLVGLQGMEINIVFHLASKAIGPHNTSDISELIQSNILLGTQLLEAMHLCGINNMVAASTVWQCVGGEKYNPWVLYAATKQAFEDIAVFYAKEYHMNISCLRLADSYGPNDWRPKILNQVKNSLKTGNIIEMSPGEQELDLVYIDDVVRAFMHAYSRLENEDFGFNTYTVTSGIGIRLRDLVNKLSEVNQVSVQANWGARPYRKNEIMNYTKLSNILPGWEPKVDINTGLKAFLSDYNFKG